MKCSNSPPPACHAPTTHFFRTCALGMLVNEHAMDVQFSYQVNQAIVLCNDCMCFHNCAQFAHYDMCIVTGDLGVNPHGLHI